MVITDPCLSENVFLPAISNQVYNLMDPGTPFTLPSASTTNSNCGVFTYSIISVLDTTVFTFNAATPSITAYTVDVLKCATYSINLQVQ